MDKIQSEVCEMFRRRIQEDGDNVSTIEQFKDITDSILCMIYGLQSYVEHSPNTLDTEEDFLNEIDSYLFV